jgi:hypothetical protein
MPRSPGDDEMRYLPIAIAFVLVGLVAGCESTSTSATTQPAYMPADGRNLSPELQKDFGHDPQWPNDIDRGPR